ncbi:MAG: IPT/TIG domain-containing protein, partial [Terracidiphilus sp.]
MTTPGGTSATGTADQYSYTPPPLPTVTGVTPNSGPSTGGTTVTITGTAFTGATEVDFTNDVRTHVLPTTFTVDSDTMITAITPAFADFVGTVDVQVETPGGTSIETADDEFNYTVPPPPTVSGVSPASGTSVGGTTVTVSGANFLGATAVAFGLTGTAFTVTNPTTITATSPPGSVGTVDVTVATPGGTSATNTSDQYTYFEPPPPTVTAVTPTGGFTIGGTTVS